jgi:hypothetical protein
MEFVQSEQPGPAKLGLVSKILGLICCCFVAAAGGSVGGTGQ